MVAVSGFQTQFMFKGFSPCLLFVLLFRVSAIVCYCSTMSSSNSDNLRLHLTKRVIFSLQLLYSSCYDSLQQTMGLSFAFKATSQPLKSTTVMDKTGNLITCISQSSLGHSAIDSSASEHLCGNKHLLTFLSPLNSLPSVTLLNGTKALVLDVG